MWLIHKCVFYYLCFHAIFHSRGNLQELTKARTELEQRLEDASSQKHKAEAQLAQSMTRLDALIQEKIKMEESNSSLEESIRSLRYIRLI